MPARRSLPVRILIATGLEANLDKTDIYPLRSLAYQVKTLIHYLREIRNSSLRLIVIMFKYEHIVLAIVSVPNEERLIV